MAKLDYAYIASLVTAAQIGDNNAFAELYLATYQKQYRFSYQYLQDEEQAQAALKETYVTALKSIHTIKDSKVFISWLSHINFRICMRRKAEMIGLVNPESQPLIINGKEYVVSQIMGLPSSESRALLLHYYECYPISKVADMMDCKKREVDQYIKSGIKRLNDLLNN